MYFALLLLSTLYDNSTVSSLHSTKYSEPLPTFKIHCRRLQAMPSASHPQPAGSLLQG